jgi:hypothetical protein
MELDKITLARWVDQAFEQALTKKNIKYGFKVPCIWPLDLNAMNNKFQPSSLYTTWPSNEGNKMNNTSNKQDGHG